MNSYHVKKGDEVIVNSGNFRGEKAKIVAVLTKKDRVVIELTGKSETKLGKRTVKKSKANPNGGLIDRAVSVHVSNVNPIADKAE
jgi:large subunit ribosomal protein L24